MTQEQVAERAGMAYQAVARLERGKPDNPTWKTVQKLAEALGVEPNDFTDKDEPPATDDKPPRPRKK